jgi:hypothetical protein
VGEPIRINCDGVSKVGASAELVALTSSGRHVVLQFSSLTSDEQAKLIAHLSAAMPDHSVFFSGGSQESPWITVRPVVARSRILERRREILQAVETYRRACVALIEQYRTRTLPGEWRTDAHGGHCRFKNRRTGQVVEVPLREWVNSERVDPYFFTMFVRSTVGLEPIAALIDHDFHDAARILDVIADEAEREVK